LEAASAHRRSRDERHDKRGAPIFQDNQTYLKQIGIIQQVDWRTIVAKKQTVESDATILVTSESN
jgi:hypothetical protein